MARGRSRALTPAEHALLDRDDVVTLISAVSVWEVRLKRQVDRRKGRPPSVPMADALVEFWRNGGIEIVPPSVTDFAASLRVPAPTLDPFDEMLLVHTQQLGARLLTRDRRLADHPLALAL